MLSLALSLVGLLVATVSDQKHWQVVLAVFVILGLVAGAGGAMAAVAGIVFNPSDLEYDQAYFWQVNGAGGIGAHELGPVVGVSAPCRVCASRPTAACSDAGLS